MLCAAKKISFPDMPSFHLYFHQCPRFMFPTPSRFEVGQRATAVPQTYSESEIPLIDHSDRLGEPFFQQVVSLPRLPGRNPSLGLIARPPAPGHDWDRGSAGPACSTTSVTEVVTVTRRNMQHPQVLSDMGQSNSDLSRSLLGSTASFNPNSD